MGALITAILKRYWQEIAIIVLLVLLMRRWAQASKILKKLEEIEAILLKQNKHGETNSGN